MDVDWGDDEGTRYLAIGCGLTSLCLLAVLLILVGGLALYLAS